MASSRAEKKASHSVGFGPIQLLMEGMPPTSVPQHVTPLELHSSHYHVPTPDQASLEAGTKQIQSRQHNTQLRSETTHHHLLTLQ